MVSTNGLTVNQEEDHYSELSCLEINYPLEFDPPTLTAREFCRKMNGLTDLSEVEILRVEMHPK